MNPVAFELFGYPIRWYGIIIAGGVLVAFFISYILAKKKELDFDIITDGFLWSFPFAIIGARLIMLHLNIKLSFLYRCNKYKKWWNGHSWWINRRIINSLYIYKKLKKLILNILM